MGVYLEIYQGNLSQGIYMQIYQGNLKSGTFKSTGSLSGTFKSIRKSVMEIYQGNLILKGDILVY